MDSFFHKIARLSPRFNSIHSTFRVLKTVPVHVQQEERGEAYDEAKTQKLNSPLYDNTPKALVPVVAVELLEEEVQISNRLYV